MKILKEIMKMFLRIYCIFPIKKNKIYLMCFKGNNIGFDQKAIVDWLNTNRKGKYKIYWGCERRKDANIINYPGIKGIKNKSFFGIYHILTSKIFICNINPPCMIPFRKKQILVNTWHGYGFKNAGKYIPNFNKEQFNLSNFFLSPSKDFSKNVIRDAFEYQGRILEFGVPRNDIFFNEEKRKRAIEKVKEIYNVKDFNLVLYAPTFRNDFDFYETTLNLKNILFSLESKFGGKWKVLYKIHPMIDRKNLNYNKQDIIDVSDYADTQELLCAADILISDYSSLMYDFSLQEKPVFIFADDIDIYIEKRGFLKSPYEWPFPVSKTTREILFNIKNFDKTQYIEQLRSFQYKNSVCDNGNSAEKLILYLEKFIEEEKM